MSFGSCFGKEKEDEDMVLWFVGISYDTMWNFTQEIILSHWFVWIIYKEICLYRKGDYESVHWIRMESCRLTHDFYKLIFLSILLRCYLICFLTRDVCGLIYGVVILDIEIIKARVFCWLLISIHWRSVKKKIDISLRYRSLSALRFHSLHFHTWSKYQL